MTKEPLGRELIPDTGILFYPDKKGKLSAAIVFPATHLALKIDVTEHGHNREYQFWPTVYGISDWDRFERLLERANGWEREEIKIEPYVTDLADEDWKTFSSSFNGGEDENEIKRTIEDYGTRGIVYGLEGHSAPKLVDDESALKLFNDHFSYWSPENPIQIWKPASPAKPAALPIKAQTAKLPKAG